MNFFPTSYSDRTHMSYGAGLEGCSNILVDASADAGTEPAGAPGDVWFGGASSNSEEVKGSVTAMDPASGKKGAPADVASCQLFWRGRDRRWTGVHDAAEGTVYALDDVTLKPLWTFSTGSLSSAPPMTYSVNGSRCRGFYRRKRYREGHAEQDTRLSGPPEHIHALCVRPLMQVALNCN